MREEQVNIVARVTAFLEKQLFVEGPDVRCQPALTEWIMANSIRARLVGVALGALTVACSSHAAPISNGN
jgi:hypothetical protein